jgi:hypothetical protein
MTGEEIFGENARIIQPDVSCSFDVYQGSPESGESNCLKLYSLNHPDHPEKIYSLQCKLDVDLNEFKSYVHSENELPGNFINHVTRGQLPGNYRGKFVIPNMSIREIDDIIERFKNDILDNQDYKFYSKWILQILDEEMERGVVQTQEIFDWERRVGDPEKEKKGSRVTTWRDGI